MCEEVITWIVLGRRLLQERDHVNREDNNRDDSGHQLRHQLRTVVNSIELFLREAQTDPKVLAE